MPNRARQLLPERREEAYSDRGGEKDERRPPSPECERDAGVGPYGPRIDPLLEADLDLMVIKVTD